MKVYGFFLVTAALACSGESNEQIDKRSPLASVAGETNEDLNPDADPAASNEENPGSTIDEEPISFSSVTLNLAANSELLNADFLSNISLASKVDAETIILFGADGTSWLYASDGSTPPEEILPLIAPPEGRTLLTMDKDDFWLVDANRVSKRKFVADAAPGDVVLINFDLSKLSGDTSQLRVLGATHESLILFLGSHVAIFSVQDGLSSAFEFSSTLPSGAGEQLISAGDLVGDGYWFVTENRFLTLRKDGGNWLWNVVDLILSPSSFSSIAARLDFDQQSIDGDLLLMSNAVYSVSGSPVVASP